ncbi:calpain-a [Plakobranchus ocellatus]|uniref:Calpain-a n=1 Tax=Plakobranchus ocellatus TaxID=259542 RepID=A0AAV4CUQ2_9GAST|nr:calpain-a [Plakobranchus ocellatus]
MSNVYKTRTIRTYVSDGNGPPRVQTKTITFGGPGGSNIGFTPSSDFGNFGDFDKLASGMPDFNNMGGQFNINMGNSFGGKNLTFDVGGGGGGGAPSSRGGSGVQHHVIGGGGSQPRPQPVKPRARGGGGTGRKVSSGPKESDSGHKLAGRSTRSLKKDPFVGLQFQKANDLKRQCRERGQLFEDPEFPAVNSSIFFSMPPPRPWTQIETGVVAGGGRGQRRRRGRRAKTSWQRRRSWTEEEENEEEEMERNEEEEEELKEEMEEEDKEEEENEEEE